MADSSEGSDIDEVNNSDFNEIREDDTGPDLNDILDELEVPADHVDREQWILAMFREGEEDRHNFLGFQEEWKTDNFHSREKIPFNRKPGVKMELLDGVTPIQVFSCVFTDDMWMRLVTQTNVYAEQTQTATPSNSMWLPVTVTEMKTFIGLCLATGIFDLPARRDIWRQKKWLFQTTIPQAMSRDIFSIIWR